KDVTAMLDKNADYLWGQAVHLNRAWVHLHAMDFAGALAICNSTLPLVRHPELRPTPDFPTPRPVIRMCLFLTGSAETALGKVHLSTCWQSRETWISPRSFGPGTGACNSNLL